MTRDERLKIDTETITDVNLVSVSPGSGHQDCCGSLSDGRASNILTTDWLDE